MEFPEDNIPKSIFFDLFREDSFLSFPDSEPVTIFFDQLMSIPFPDPVTEIVPDHRSDDGCEDREEEMISSPESADQYHHIHPRDCCSDDRQWLDARREKCDEIIPVTELHDKIPDPYDRSLDPLRTDEWYDEDSKCQEGEDDGEEFCDEWERSFDHEKRGLWCL